MSLPIIVILFMEKTKLLDFINHDLLLNRSPESAIVYETDLIASGVIDSLSLIQLVTYLEKETGLSIPDRDVNPDNFRSVETIVAYLNQRQNMEIAHENTAIDA